MKNIKLKIVDYFIIAFSIIIIMISIKINFHNNIDALTIKITGQDREWVYPIEDTNIELSIPGPIGTTHVHIKEKEVYVHTSPCIQKICISSGKISKQGTWIACLPNKVMISIEGNNEKEIDGISF